MSVFKGKKKEKEHIGPGDKRSITTLANCSGWSSSVFGGGSYPLVPNIERKKDPRGSECREGKKRKEEEGEEKER